MRSWTGNRTIVFGLRSATSAHLQGNLSRRSGNRPVHDSRDSQSFVDGGIAGRARSAQPWLIPSLPVDHDTLHSHIRLSAASASLATELLPDASGAPVEAWVIPAPDFDVERHIEVPTGNPTRAGTASVVGDAAIHERRSKN